MYRSTADSRGTGTTKRSAGGGSERVRRAPAEGGRRRARTDRKEAFSCRTKTDVRRNFVQGGPALERKRTPPVPKILDGDAEIRVIALYRGRQGYANWSLRLLASGGTGGRGKPRNGEADAKKRRLLQKETLGNSA